MDFKLVANFIKRISFYIAMCLVIANCSGQSSSQKPKADLKMISWLKGTWEQNDLKQGKKGWETWQVMDAHQMAGTGITMEGRDTVEMEKITILLKNDTAYYIANVKENPEPVFFRFTRLTKDSFVCENPDHDFPKKVVYRKDGNALIATISGNDDSISYSYRRKP